MCLTLRFVFASAVEILGNILSNTIKICHLSMMGSYEKFLYLIKHITAKNIGEDFSSCLCIDIHILETYFKTFIINHDNLQVISNLFIQY